MPSKACLIRGSLTGVLSHTKLTVRDIELFMFSNHLEARYNVRRTACSDCLGGRSDRVNGLACHSVADRAGGGRRKEVIVIWVIAFWKAAVGCDGALQVESVVVVVY